MHSWFLGTQVVSETPLESHLTEGQGEGEKSTRHLESQK